MMRTNVAFVTFFILWLGSIVYALNENDSCTDPDDKPGKCIKFRDCDSVMQVYSKPILSPDDLEFVERSLCGQSEAGSLVCCAELVVDPETRFQKTTLPKPPNCGVDLSDRIFGGQKTGLDEFPWTALIEYRKPNGQTGFHCGASLINFRYVVTAAHCINPRGWEIVGVRLGEWDLENERDCLDDICADAPVNMEVEKIIVHEDYNTQVGQQHDIALIRFTKEVNMTSFISPVCLPIDDKLRTRNIVGSKGWAAGWGRTENGSTSNIKLKVELGIQDRQSCSNTYIKSGITVHPTQLCAGGVHGQDTCSGDSGGPLTKLETANHFLFGIVSFGPRKCGTKDVPGVYTNVAKYVDWIESKI